MDYLENYKKIVKDEINIQYIGPDEQGESIKKFTLMEDEDIQYGGIDFFSNPFDTSSNVK